MPTLSRPIPPRRRLVQLQLAFAFVAAGFGASLGADPAPLTDQPRQVAVPAAGTSVPIRFVSGKPVVDVFLDGRGPFAFFLDTGAGATVLDTAFVKEIGLDAIGTTTIGDPADPEGISATKHRVGRLAIGDSSFEEFFAVAFDRSALYRPGPNGEAPPRGVLGMPLFRDVLLTLDYPAGTLRLSSETLPPADGREIVDYRTTEADLFGVPVRVAGKEQWMTLDSGASGSLTFPDAARTTLPLVAPAKEIGRGRTVGGDAPVYGATLDGAFELGAIRLERPEIRFFGRLTHGNLGSGFLSAYAIAIDQRNRRLRVRPAAATPAMGDAALARYVGTYGIRRITLERGQLHLQRLSGPEGEGPKIPLTETGTNRFALQGQREPRVEFLVAPDDAITALRILTREGAWETAPREP